MTCQVTVTSTVSKLNGEIIYNSPFHGAQNQAHWNELNLWQCFVGKTFGIMGNGGFTFNRVDDEEKIIGDKPPTGKSRRILFVPLTGAPPSFERCLSASPTHFQPEIFRKIDIHKCSPFFKMDSEGE
jgi:hypothetical protein